MSLMCGWGFMFPLAQSGSALQTAAVSDMYSMYVPAVKRKDACQSVPVSEPRRVANCVVSAM